MNKKEHTCMIGNLRIQVSNMKKALDVIQRYNITVKFSTKNNIIEFNLGDSIFITIDQLTSILQELKPLCVPVEHTWDNPLNHKIDMDGGIQIQVSDIGKTFEIIQKHNIGVELSTRVKKIQFDLRTLTIDQFTSILQELKLLCEPLVPPFFRCSLIAW